MDKHIHETYMKTILHDIFSSTLKNDLAFKWWTLAYFLYNLDRFSTDIDLDLLDSTKEQQCIQIIQNILVLHGDIKNETLGNTIHRWIFRYDETNMNIKIECNKRVREHNRYHIQTIHDKDILCMDPSSIITNKLVALSERRYARDLYDIHFFLQKGRKLNDSLIQERTSQNTQELIQAIIEELPKYFQPQHILHGLGEVLDSKQKSRVKTHLLTDTITLLQNYTTK